MHRATMIVCHVPDCWVPTRLWAKGAFQTARRVRECFLQEGIFHLSFGG